MYIEFLKKCTLSEEKNNRKENKIVVNLASGVENQCQEMTPIENKMYPMWGIATLLENNVTLYR